MGNTCNKLKDKEWGALPPERGKQKGSRGTKDD